MFKKHLLPGAVCFVLASAASADLVQVDWLGGAVDMHAGAFADLELAGSQFTEADMVAIHSQLDDAGIITDGRITSLLAHTNAGLTFITLIDSGLGSGALAGGGGGGGQDSTIVLSSTGPNSLNGFANAEGADIAKWQTLHGGLQLFSGMFHWDSAGEADGFAWGNLGDGDFVSYHLTDLGAPGLDPHTPFQFVSFSEGTWETVATGDFTGANQFVFSYQVIPAPAVLSLIAIGGLVSRRRRCRAS